MAVFKSAGTTPSERLLTKLCEQTFLGFWSYPNTYRDQGGPKELCDLLVVCGNHIILFSDKSCRFPDTGDLKLDWSRWFPAPSRCVPVHAICYYDQKMNVQWEVIK